MALFAVPPAYARLKGAKRWIMVGLRAAMILLVVVAMLRPTRVSSQSQPQTATLILLLDESRSLQVADDPGGESRWEALLETIRPENLALSEGLLRLIPPRPLSYEETRDLFPGRTGRTFDPLAAAETAAGITVGLLLHPERAARLV